MKTPNKGKIFLRQLEGADRFTLNGKKYQVIIHDMSAPLKSRIWVYDFSARRSVIMIGKTEIPEGQIQLFTAV